MSGGQAQFDNYTNSAGTGAPTFPFGANATTNFTANNFAPGYTTTVSSGTTITLTASSTRLQYITGTSAQLLVLPVVSTLSLGFSFILSNYSNLLLTVQTSGASQLTLLDTGAQAEFTVISTSGTGTSSWAVRYLAPAEWRPYTLTIGGNSSAPTKATSPAIDSAWYRQVGDSIEMVYSYYATSASGAAAGSGTYFFGFPTFFSADPNKLATGVSSDGGSNMCGNGVVNFGGTLYPAYARIDSTLTVSSGVVLYVSDYTNFAPVSSTNRQIAGNATVGYFFRATIPAAQLTY